MNPGVQSSLIPLFGALAGLFIIRRLPQSIQRVAGLSVLVGFLAASYFTFGLPPFPPIASGQKITYIAIFAGILAVGANAKNLHGRPLLILSGIGLLVSIAWIGWKKLAVPISMDHMGALLIFLGSWLAAFLVMAPVRTGKEDDSDDLVILLVISIAIAINALMGASASIAQNAGSLAASLGAVVLYNMFGRKLGIDTVSRLVPVILLAALLGQIYFFTSLNILPVALLPLSFLAKPIANKTALASLDKSKLFRPFIIGAISVVPAIASVAITWVIIPATSGGY